MGKKRKFSKGHHLSSGFVSDYQQEVEIIEESEGHGSSGRVDMEVMASEDSRAHKRKCISLNADGNGPFGVGIQVLRLSKLTHSELRNLELRLKNELELVRVLQKQVASMGSNIVTASSSIDVINFNNVKNKPPFGLDPPPPCDSGLHLKGVGSRPSFVHQNRARALSSSNSVLVKQCETLLNRMMSQTTSWLFNSPVDAVKLNIPDYFTIIKNPMDLGTVKNKLISGRYSDLRDFASDVRLTFSNAMTYNPPENSVHILAANLRKFFEVRWKNIEKKLHVLIEKNLPVLQPGLHSGSVIERNTDPAVPSVKKSKITPVENKMKSDSVKRIMTVAEKHTLSTELEALLTELPENIIQFLNKHSSSDAQTADGDILVDIDALNHDTLFELQNLLRSHQLKQRKKLKNIESSEVKLPNESGLSNLSIQHCKANKVSDEDVDIGGNDPYTSADPQILMEKDITMRNIKSSHTSSSSSDSDTSSDSISGSGLNVADASASATKTVAVRAKISKGKNDVDNAGIVNSSLIGLGQVVQALQPKSILPDFTVDTLDGGCAPSERQVSPEKLYRAALLKNRFADTILKAREKALEKSETLDPERLRLEKEELERQQKQEKARLLAEAMAAEEAQRKAAADAAAFAVAEAKKRRDLEREAARVALQKMEKTVDINESCQFLKDLELLRASDPDENLSFMEDISPDCALNALGSFKFEGAGNPLEQLGLYMKDDLEEDEEPINYVNVDADVDGAEDGEVPRILESVIDGGSQRIPETLNGVRGFGGAQRGFEGVMEEGGGGSERGVSDDGVMEEDDCGVWRGVDVDCAMEEGGGAHINGGKEDDVCGAHINGDKKDDSSAAQNVSEVVITLDENGVGERRVMKRVNEVGEYSFFNPVDDVGEGLHRDFETVNDDEEDDGGAQSFHDPIKRDVYGAQSPFEPMKVEKCDSGGQLLAMHFQEDDEAQKTSELLNEQVDGGAEIIAKIVDVVENDDGAQTVGDLANGFGEDNGVAQSFIEPVYGLVDDDCEAQRVSQPEVDDEVQTLSDCAWEDDVHVQEELNDESLRGQFVTEPVNGEVAMGNVNDVGVVIQKNYEQSEDINCKEQNYGFTEKVAETVDVGDAVQSGLELLND